MADVTYDPLAYAWRVLLVFALLFGAAFWLRRQRQAGGGLAPGRRQLQVVESLAIGPQRNLHIVAVGDQRYLIGVTPQAITFLTKIETETPTNVGPGSSLAAEGELTPETQFKAYVEKAGGGTPKEDVVR